MSQNPSPEAPHGLWVLCFVPTDCIALIHRLNPMRSKTDESVSQSIVRKVETGFRKNNATEQKVRPA
ncbi:hypothetical protein GCM10027396_24540 [Insolitispirillum peregrinum]